MDWNWFSEINGKEFLCGRWAPPHNPQIHPFHSTPQSEIEFHFFICWLGLRCTRSPCSSFGGAPMRIRPQPKKRARELREWNKKYFNNNLRCAGPHAHSFFLFFDAGPNPQQKEREWELREKKKEMSLLFKKKGVGSSLLLAGCLRLAAAYNPQQKQLTQLPQTNSINHLHKEWLIGVGLACRAHWALGLGSISLTQQKRQRQSTTSSTHSSLISLLIWLLLLRSLHFTSCLLLHWFAFVGSLVSFVG